MNTLGGVGGAQSVIALEVVHSDGVASNFVHVEHLIRSDIIQERPELQLTLIQGHAGDSKFANCRMKWEFVVVDWTSDGYLSLKKILNLCKNFK